MQADDNHRPSGASKNEPMSSSAGFLKTDGGKTKSNAIEIPSISLPKGGGAIKGIDEKFSVNAVNGTASFSIPLPFAPARGASPALSLSYNSGSGNGIFGLGWNISLPSIKRKTDKGLPQYFDNIDSDIFLFSEVEDLVPVFEKENGAFTLIDGEYVILEKDYPTAAPHTHKIRFYRPRIEGLFARIERWTATATGEIKWRIITKDNTTTLFGWSAGSRIADPADASRIYEWLPEFVFDDKGNCSQYIYAPDDIIDIDFSAGHNKNRIEGGRLTYTNLYLSKIVYGNKTPFFWQNNFPAEDNYLFSTVFDYYIPKPENDPHVNDSPAIINTWTSRPDSFSDYKAGFEIRTTRLCKRVLLFHVFEELALKQGKPDKKTLVKSLNFGYDTSTQKDFTFLKTITAFGYIKFKNADDSLSYSQKNLPPTEFTYQLHEWNKDVKTISTENTVHAPSGLDESQYQFTDLFNEGLSGILTEQAAGWYYKHNLGNGEFENARLVSPKPSFAGLGSQLHLADLDADGGKQLVNYSAEPKGYFELNDEEEWQPFKNFKGLPNINLNDANTRMLDLNGDGKAEALISEDNVFTWYESAGKDGFKASKRTEKPYDEEAGTAIVFADSEQRIFLADMSGDGLSDIVRIRNGEVCYWPNLGYGKFGAKVLMDDSPVFDYPDAFNPAYVRLADIDGSGTTDIIYLGKNKFSCWSNFSGNSFDTAPFEIDAFPDIHNQSKITITDLLGNGVACIVRSSPLAKDAHAPLSYIDLMNSKKPHIMVKYVNNMGKVVSMEYLPSTVFYLEDKKAGKPWVTKLHFPVHCVASTKTEDKISGHVFVSTYKYHHGYYDHAEREFRGFGMVEQQDAEEFEKWKKVEATNKLEDDTLNQPPVISKSWVHTGAFLGEEKILNQFAKEYWFEEMKRQGFNLTHHEHPLPDAKIVDENGNNIADELDAQDWQEALRACKGMALRAEVFSKDDLKQKQLTPYSVATHNCIIQRLQPRVKNEHAVFIVKESEAITYSYERLLYPSAEPVVWEADPRIAHNLNIKFDDMGNVLEAASVVYPRNPAKNTSLPEPTKIAQALTYITYSQTTFTNDVDVAFEANKPDAYRLRLPAEVKTWQLTNVPKIGSYYSIEKFINILSDTKSTKLEYYQVENPLPTDPTKRRLIEHIRTTYRNNDLICQLAIGEMHSLGISYQSYQLAYTKELLNNIYNPKVTDPELMGIMKLGKFVSTDTDSKWWVASGTTNFIDANNLLADTLDEAKARFYLPISYTDPYGSVTKVEYETNKLFVQKTIDALQNESIVTKFNYRILSPQQMQDMNDNLSEAITDELGLVKAMAVMGKDFNDDKIGDEADDLSLLTEITTDQTAINEFFVIANADGVCNSDNLHSKAKDLLKYASARFVYDFNAYIHYSKPVVVASIVRETHYRDKDKKPGDQTNLKLQLSFEYSNGLGKVIMKKVQAEPGDAKEVIVNADKSVTTILRHTDQTAPKQLRWIGNGRTILNNKGNQVKQYEPFFSVSPKFDNEKELVETGVTPIMFYDAMSRLIKTDMPDGTFSKVEFDPWQQKNFDANDTVYHSDCYKKRTDATRPDYLSDPQEQMAAAKAFVHFNTPTQLHFDTLGRPVLEQENNGSSHFDSTGNVVTTDVWYDTAIKLDIEGNLRNVTDARENVVMEYKYDMLGNKVYQKSMDAGQRWLLLNITGNPLRTWDERDHEFQYEYDKLHRPIKSTVINTVGQIGDKILNNVFDKIIYGEGISHSGKTDKQLNLRGNFFKHYDTGGLIETPEYDFKGQPPSTKRKLFKDYKGVVNWKDANVGPLVPAGLFEDDEFISITETDALGRITKQIAPDGSTITPSYNEAGVLNTETVEDNAGLITVYIKDIDYNEKGQRTKIIYGNDVTTKYEYDKVTFRLKRLQTQAIESDNEGGLQDLNYTYDPVGNILRVEDKANDTIFFKNMKVEPVSEYRYDALYRLKEAKGRENDTPLNFSNPDNWNDIPKMKDHQPGDPMAVVPYTESYAYDQVGNITEINHIGSWHRVNTYETKNNRLISSTVAGITFKYTHHLKHGFMSANNLLEKALPHLEDIGWNFKEEVTHTIKQRVTNGVTPETTYYQYDGQGQRIRKITENSAAVNNDPTKKDERTYIAGYETYRIHDANGKFFERESLSLMDKEHRFVMIETVKQNDATSPSPLERAGVRLTRYQLHNHLGSACLELNADAEVIGYEEYHPYGTTAYQAKSTAIKCAAKLYRYTGMERDEETGLEYHSARYYLPWLGRWLSCDPSGMMDSTNLYLYTNNPIRYLDKDGNKLYAPEWGTNEKQNQAIMKVGASALNALVQSRKEEIKKGVSAFKKGNYGEGMGSFLGMNSSLEAIAEKDYRYEKGGASNGERAALAMGDETGFNDLMEFHTKYSVFAEPLSKSERVVKYISGVFKLGQTVMMVASVVNVGKTLLKGGYKSISGELQRMEMKGIDILNEAREIQKARGTHLTIAKKEVERNNIIDQLLKKLSESAKVNHRLDVGRDLAAEELGLEITGREDKISQLKKLIKISKSGSRESKSAQQALEGISEGIGNIEIGGNTAPVKEVNLEGAMNELNKLDNDLLQLRKEKLNGREF